MLATDVSEDTPLAILDPALGRTGAHNRGFAEMMAAEAGGDLSFWCNVGISDKYKGVLSRRGATVSPLFSLDFYRLTHQPGGIAEHWDWVYGFAKDYEAALREVVSRWPGTPVRVLHHTLSWEHASALWLAIRQLGDAGRLLEHVALLMYSPGVAADGEVLDPIRRRNFRLAFSALAGLSNVSLHAACGEYAAAYASLLGTKAPLPLHPCFLGDWRRRPVSNLGSRSDSVLAYVGEIKQEKGFIDLPERLATMLRDPACSSQRFVVQITDARTPTAHEVLGKLRAMAAADRRIELHEGYWSDEELRYWFSHAAAICLDYDATVYSHKSSGLLWLAAWHGLPVRVPPESWLDREARRLGVPRIPSDRAPVAKFARRDTGGADPEYFREIFAPFHRWIQSLPGRPDTVVARPFVSMPEGDGIKRKAEDEIREAKAQADVREGRSGGPVEGVDIILFWKQNDSTLYGRRNDMVARYLAARKDVRKVIVVDAPVSDSRLAALASGDGVDQQRWIYTRTLEKLCGKYDSDTLMHKLFVYPSEHFAWDEHEQPGAEFINAYAEFLGDEFAREGVDPRRAVFWIYPRDYCMPALLRFFDPARTVVDVVDDHRAWPNVSAADKARLSNNYRELLGGADLVLTNCETVRSAMREYNDQIRVVPNGCDEDPKSSSSAETHEVLAEIDAHRGKVIGFVGNLEPKIDVKLLDELARRFPEHLLVLVGSTHANPGVRALLHHPNVRMPGVVPYDQLGAWLSRFDVGLIPHLDMKLTRHMNPLKAHVYLGWKIPVVTTSVANVQADGELVRMAVSHRAFLHQVEMVLAGSPPAPERFREYVAANGWRIRLEAQVNGLALDQI